MRRRNSSCYALSPMLAIGFNRHTGGPMEQRVSDISNLHQRVHGASLIQIQRHFLELNVACRGTRSSLPGLPCSFAMYTDNHNNCVQQSTTTTVYNNKHDNAQRHTHTFNTTQLLRVSSNMQETVMQGARSPIFRQSFSATLQCSQLPLCAKTCHVYE